MKKILLILVLVGLLFSGFCGNVSAEVQPGTFTISPMAGIYKFDGDKKLLDYGYLYSVMLGYNFNRVFSAELGGGLLHTDADVGDDDDIYGYHYRLDGIIHLMPELNLDPYIAVGIGGMNYDDSDTNDHRLREELDDVFQVNVGGGFNYFFMDNVAFRADARYMYGLEKESDKEFLFTAGLTFQIGGEQEPDEACVDRDRDGICDDVDPCVDVDNDGVCDNMDKCPNTPKGVRVNNDGCPEPYAVMQRTSGTDEAVTQSDQQTKKIPETQVTVYFDFDQTNIKPEYQARLRELADLLIQYPDMTAVIEGHTCNIGSEEYNMSLSEKRAEAVKQFLVDSYSINPGRLDTRGYGESQPAESNATEQGRIMNRRAVTTTSAVTITVK